MPNWCNNVITLQGPQGLIDRAKRAIERNELCNEFFSMPGELRDTTSPSDSDDPATKALIERYGYANWYDFAVNEWGTKWDTCDGTIQEEGPGYIVASFDTAWSPPIALMEKLPGHGFDSVVLDYVEFGMNYVGQWNNGDDECYEIDEDIPDHMNDMWGISELLDAQQNCAE
jgi:hypothetical protein